MKLYIINPLILFAYFSCRDTVTLFFVGGFMISTVNKLEFQRCMYTYVIRVNKACVKSVHWEKRQCYVYMTEKCSIYNWFPIMKLQKSLNILLSEENLGLKMVCFAVHQLHSILFVGICQFKGHDYLCR